MQTGSMAAAVKQDRARPQVQVLRSEQTVDARLWARQYVSVLLALEGVSVTPTAIADAS